MYKNMLSDVIFDLTKEFEHNRGDRWSHRNKIIDVVLILSIFTRGDPISVYIPYVYVCMRARARVCVCVCVCVLEREIFHLHRENGREARVRSKDCSGWNETSKQATGWHKVETNNACKKIKNDY